LSKQDRIKNFQSTTFPKDSFGKTPYLDDIEKIKNNGNLVIDENKYVHRKNNPANYSKDLLEKYNKKKLYLESLTISEVFEKIGNKAIFEIIRNSQLKLQWPQDYPIQPKKSDKEVYISRLNQAYRLGGHLDAKELTFFLFWVDLSKCDIFDH
jgi:hypothetical protein